MSRINLQKPRRYVLGAVSSILFAVLATTSHADQLEEHDSLVQKYISEQHANPLVADCAAHAVFVVSTSNYYDHVDFADTALDDQHATVQPWNDAFDNGKQRIKVDTIVTVNGQGMRKGGTGTPDALTFKCGFLEDKLLAFSYNDPVAASSGTGAHGKRHGKGTRSTHGHSAHGAAHTAKPASGTHGKPAPHGSAGNTSNAKAVPPKKTPPVKSNSGN